MDNGTLIGLPVAIATFATILNSQAITILLIVSISSIGVAALASGLASVVGGLEISFLGFGIKVPKPSDWFIRFLFISTFLSIYYTANIIAGLNIILAIPYSVGPIIVGVLSAMFVFGMFDYASGQGSSGSKS